MKCSLTALCVVLLLAAPNTLGQTTPAANIGEKLSQNTPAHNVLGGAVRARAPGRIIDAARAQHVAMAKERLAAQRAGDTSSLLAESAAFGSTGSSGLLDGLLGSAGSGLLGSLLNSGALGGLDIGNLIGGGSTGGTTGGSTGGTSGLPPEVIQMLLDAGINLGDLNLKGKDSGTSQVKSSTLTQQTNLPAPEERRFVLRWGDAMLSTIFTAATVGFQTQDFIDIIKDAFRPFLVPQSNTAGVTESNVSQDTSGG